MGLRPSKGDEGSRGARTPACRVHTRVNAWLGSKKGVRRSANTARRSACATGVFNGAGAWVTKAPVAYLARNFTNNDTAIPNPMAITTLRTATRPIRRATPAPLYPPAIAPIAMITTKGQ